LFFTGGGKESGRVFVIYAKTAVGKRSEQVCAEDVLFVVGDVAGYIDGDRSWEWFRGGSDLLGDGGAR
jgi:hypothetical protein